MKQGFYFLLDTELYEFLKKIARQNKVSMGSYLRTLLLQKIATDVRENHEKVG